MGTVTLSIEVSGHNRKDLVSSQNLLRVYYTAGHFANIVIILIIIIANLFEILLYARGKS